jgi:plasmanylethanolamine desaturase
MTQKTKQWDPNELQAGYTAKHRRLEIGATIVLAVTFVWLCVRIAQCQPLSGWFVPLAALVGLLFSDFVSGFVHWLFDTWGSLDTPIFGKLAIRTFRHHHADEKAITRHDFIETNGHNFGLSILYTTSGLLFIHSKTATLTGVFVGQCLIAATIFTGFTSQIHKWAHQNKPHRFIQLLQRARIILSPQHHALHHSAPYNRNYCITVGWMNGPLRSVRFFEMLERIITAVTGAVPREDDIGKEAAVEVAQQIEEEMIVARPAEEGKKVYVTRD